MQPTGEHISIELIPECSEIISDKEPLSKVIVKEISPDISVPFKSGDMVWVSHGRIININSQLFVSKEFCSMYVANQF